MTTTKEEEENEKCIKYGVKKKQQQTNKNKHKRKPNVKEENVRDAHNESHGTNSTWK